MRDNQIFCVLLGHEYVHEVQVITQIFFANCRFTFGEEIPTDGYAVVSRLINNTEVTCIGELYKNGQKVSSCTLEASQDRLDQLLGNKINLMEDTQAVWDVQEIASQPGIKVVKRTLMLALFHGLKEATGQPTPWGALVGVRPAKQVRIWLEEGKLETHIAKCLKDVYQCRDDKIQLAMAVAQAEKNLIIRQKQQKPGVGLYIGIPFCPSRCLYCSFVAAQKAGPDAHKRYLAALAKECETIAEKRLKDLKAKGRVVNTVYIGGGTPTALSEEYLAVLLETVGRLFGPFMEKAEYTVEAGRPDSITREKLTLLKDHGVNRIAINPQTLNDETLLRIGRGHTARDFYKAYGLAQKVGFTNINTDVIAGLPGEGPKDMAYTMEGLIKLAPAHITVHTLAVKRASKLLEIMTSKKSGFEQKSSDILRASKAHNVFNEYDIDDYFAKEFDMIDNMLVISQEACQSLGLSPYYMYRQKNMIGHFENVGYSLPGCECIYNVAMMAETQTVLAAGAGGVTKFVSFAEDKSQEGPLITRDFNPKDVETYIGRVEAKIGIQ